MATTKSDDKTGTDVGFDPDEHTVAEVLDHLEENPDDRDAVLESEASGKARKGVLEAFDDDDGGLGPLGAVTSFREDFAGRDLVNPGVNALDYLGRATTATGDYMGIPLRRMLRANSTAVALKAELQFTGGAEFNVTTAGTTAVAEPAVPAVGATVTDGTAVLTRTK